jgi:hypothetical protein
MFITLVRDVDGPMHGQVGVEGEQRESRQSNESSEASNESGGSSLNTHSNIYLQAHLDDL